MKHEFNETQYGEMMEKVAELEEAGVNFTIGSRHEGGWVISEAAEAPAPAQTESE